MISLTSLPCELLEEVFHQLNQHYTLALAPLHSKLYYIAKPKLYRNIYVYTPWPIIEYGVESNEQGETFHISKNLNNFKSKSIQSSHQIRLRDIWRKWTRHRRFIIWNYTDTIWQLLSVFSDTFPKLGFSTSGALWLFFASLLGTILYLVASKLYWVLPSQYSLHCPINELGRVSDISW